MATKDKKWFELEDIIQRTPEKQSWTPLWQSKGVTLSGRNLFNGYASELFINHAICFPVEQKEEALKIKWDSVCLGFGNQPDTYGDKYKAVDLTNFYDSQCEGFYPCLEQYFDVNPKILHLNQDIVFALRLIQQGDTWVNPYEDDTVVAKIERDAESHVESLKIRTDYFRDYLCARKMGAVIYTYHERSAIDKEDPKFWEKDKEKESQQWRWTGDTRAIHEGTAMPYGGKMRVVTVTRENTDYEEDIPELQAKNPEDNKSDHFDKGFAGEKVYSSLGRLWINQWLAPFDKSPRVKGDDQPSNSFFYSSNDGKKISGSELRANEGWLWFKPDLVPEILKRKRSSLKWYTRETGEIAFHRAASLHFGVNKEGLINIICEEVGLLDEYHRNILAGFNVTPDGGVSKELLMAQKDGMPAGTKAAEWLLAESFEYLNRACEECLKKSILREHTEFEPILKNIHRFRAMHETGLYELANDLNRIFVERLDQNFIRELSGNKESVGSIKDLAKLIDSYGKDGRNFTCFLAGCYELRHGITHLPSSEIKDAYELAGLDQNNKPYQNAEILIHVVANTIGVLSNLIRENNPK